MVGKSGAIAFSFSRPESCACKIGVLNKNEGKSTSHNSDKQSNVPDKAKFSSTFVINLGPCQTWNSAFKKRLIY
jgi:hypothetical protein